MKYNLEDAYSLKHVVEDLFGRNSWLEIKHATEVPTWKKYATRILSAILLSAKSTVEIYDSEWVSELEAEIKHGKETIKLSKDTEQLFAALAAVLARVSFLQLGRMPCNYSRKQVTLRHSGNWKLNQFRSVQYVQSSKQAQNKAAHNKTLKKDAQKPRAS